MFLSKILLSSSFLIPALLALLVRSSSAAHAVTLDDFAARTYVNSQGAKLPYRLFIPVNYDSATKYPLVLFFHGSSARGLDNQSQFKESTGSWVFLSNANQIKHPCFLVAPQCPAGRHWDADRLTRQQVLAMLASLQTEFSIDADRLYVTGLSWGGYATWAIITRNPNMFAAAVPMSGEGLLYPFGLITHMAIWNFHAANDDIVKVSHSDYIISALRDAGGSPIYTRYQNGAHPIWETAYRTPGLVDWVMSQKRGVSPTPPFDLALTTPTGQPDFTTTARALSLAGTASGRGSDITSITWKNTLNGASGTASGTSNWSIDGVPLESGAINSIMVIGRGPSWSSSYGGSTTVNRILRVAAEAPIPVTIAAHGRNVAVSWSGGAPPYLVQQTTGLGSPNWEVVQSNLTRNATFPMSGNAAFYRILGSPTIPRSVTVDDFSARVYVDGSGKRLPYRLFVPTHYDPSRKYPLVVFLHGYAEAGADNRSQLTFQTSPLVFVSPENQQRNPCFMVAPQCPDDGEWYDAVRRPQLRALLNELQSDFSIDADRLYITGLSAGGIGVWDAIIENPNLFAAAVPVSSSPSGGPLNRITQLPLWIFQSADDIVAGILDMDKLVSDLRNLGGTPIFTRYQTGGHAVWTTAYKTPGLVDWVMAQKRGTPSIVAPRLTITGPTDHADYASTETAVDLTGIVLDSRWNISSVTWKNVRNANTATATGTTNWLASGVPLDNGTNNLITVTARGTSWSAEYGGNTTFGDAVTVTVGTGP